MKGQSLFEVIIALGIGVVLISSAAALFGLSLRQDLDARLTQYAAALSEEYINNLRVLSEADWHVVYNPPASKGPSSQFYLAPNGLSYSIAIGTTSTVSDGVLLTRSFAIENVNRDGSGNIVSVGGTDDPSTQKITATVTWKGGWSVVKTEYLTRYQNQSFDQTDWSGGGNQAGPITVPGNVFSSSTNIDYSSLPGSLKIQGY